MIGSLISECQKKNMDLLKNLPEPFDIRCPHCLAYLKLTPKVKKYIMVVTSYFMDLGKLNFLTVVRF